MFDDLLEIDETKKDEKYKKQEEEHSPSTFSFDESLIQNNALKQANEDLEKQKLDEEKKAKEEQERKNVKKPVKFGPSLETLGLTEEVAPTIDEFSRSSNKRRFPSVVNDGLNILTARTEEFRNNLLYNNLDISANQQELVSEFTNLLQSKLDINLPDTPLTYDRISSIEIKTITNLLQAISYLEQSVSFIGEVRRSINSNEIELEFISLTKQHSLYTEAAQAIFDNLNIYLTYKGDV